MNNRLKKLRKRTGLSQKAFGDRLGVTDAAICAIEKGRRNLTEQMARSICHEFNVNYEWLKYGIGEVFAVTPESLVDELSNRFDLDDLDSRIILGYLQLPASDRAAIKRYIQTLVDMAGEAPKKKHQIEKTG